MPNIHKFSRMIFALHKPDSTTFNSTKFESLSLFFALRYPFFTLLFLLNNMKLWLQICNWNYFSAFVFQSVVYAFMMDEGKSTKQTGRSKFLSKRKHVNEAIRPL